VPDRLDRACGLHLDLALGVLDQRVRVGPGLLLHLVGETCRVRAGARDDLARFGARFRQDALRIRLHLLQFLSRLAGVVQRLLDRLLARFAWRPLLDALEQRQEVIRKSLDDARLARQELEQVKTEAAKLLSDARVEAGEIVSRTRSDAARFADEMKVKARADADALVKHAERQIEMQTKRAVETIRLEAVDLSVAIASKILRRDISKEDHERLFQETLKEMQSRFPN